MEGYQDVYRLSASTLIDELLVGFEKALCFMSLHMASGFCTIRMTERAKLISTFRLPVRIVRLPSVEEAEVDQEVLNYLNLDPQDDRPPECGVPGCTSCENDHATRLLPTRTDQMTVFKRNIPAPTQMSSVLGCSSYIGDIAHGAPTWDALLRYWNISASLPKSEFGKLSISYLSHEISAERIRMTPKIAKGVQDLLFPTTMKGVQSFMGSLNYYHEFIEDYPELSDDQVRSGRDLTRAKKTFEIGKRKIVSTSVLRHPDRTKPFIIIPHANQWDACAVLDQERDGLIQPVRLTGRILHDEELWYGIVEKEVIAVLRFSKALIQGCPLIVYTRHSVLKRTMKSKTADGRCVPWGVLILQWNIDIRKNQREEDELAAILGAGITPRDHLDEIAEELIPARGRAKPPLVISVEMLEDTFEGIVLSFDGATKTATRQGSCGCILWELPGWKILDAQGFILESVTMNDAEYCGTPERPKHGTSQGHFDQAADFQTSKTLLLGKSWGAQEDNERRHLEQISKIQEKLMKSSEAHPAESHPGLMVIQDEGNSLALGTLTFWMQWQLHYRMAKILPAFEADQHHKDHSTLWNTNGRYRGVLKCTRKQDEYLCDIRDFLNGEVDRFTPRKFRKIAKDPDLFALDAPSRCGRPRDAQDELRLVVPTTLRDDILHYAHEDFQGGHLGRYQAKHQGIKRSHEKLRSGITGPGHVERHVKKCVDCSSGKEHPSNLDRSP
ncbi:LOW QUALITY PROTEIN: reverse transcriptase [Phytophthora megakarya]|uniref:Reverse transcriptase n=1 Tax=Phytophthora megakarya TaxID=4795 RepID=A0A225W3U2_9STRA|nr:LOW QUALITY PROTEIN: reverse transcriptase [Phytophthora megakarya]